MADRVQFRRDTASNWMAYNPILLEGELGFELDTDQYKLGDGVHNWNNLPYRGMPCVQQRGQSTTVAMSQKAVTDELNLIGVFDISEHNLTDGQPTKYADLTAALGTNGDNVHAQYRVPGMTIRYVRSDGKYMQCRYMSDDVTTIDTFTNPDNWQEVDKTPIQDSPNLAESGGVYKDDTAIYKKLCVYSPDKQVGRAFNNGGVIGTNGDANYERQYFSVTEGDVIVVSFHSDNYAAGIVEAYNSTFVRQLFESTQKIDYRYVVPAGVNKVFVQGKSSQGGAVVALDAWRVFDFKNNIAQETGSATTKVMSQKAVTDAIPKIDTAFPFSGSDTKVPSTKLVDDSLYSHTAVATSEHKLINTNLTLVTNNEYDSTPATPVQEGDILQISGKTAGSTYPVAIGYDANQQNPVVLVEGGSKTNEIVVVNSTVKYVLVCGRNYDNPRPALTIKRKIYTTNEEFSVATTEINTKITDIDRRKISVSLIGNGDSLVSKRNYAVKPGNTYRVYVKNPNISLSGITVGSTYTRINIVAYNASTTNIGTLVSVTFENTNPLEDYYDILIPNGCEYITISMRAATGAEQILTFVDITAVNNITQYDDYEIFDHYYVHTNGTRAYNVSVNYEATDFIPVNEGDKFLYSGEVSSGVIPMAGYDANKTPGTVQTLVAVRNTPYVNYEVIIPSGVSYIVACARNATGSTSGVRLALKMVFDILKELMKEDTRISALEKKNTKIIGIYQYGDNKNVNVYDRNTGNYLTYSFARCYKKWDSLSYLDGDGNTQQATNIVSSDVWNNYTISRNGVYIAQGNTNEIYKASVTTNHCGSQHGMEVVEFEKFYLDGKEIDFANIGPTPVWGDVFRCVWKSKVYKNRSNGGTNNYLTNEPELDTNGQPIVQCEHFLDATFSLDGVKINNRLVVKQNNMTFYQMFGAMLECYYADFDTVIANTAENTINSVDNSTFTPIGGSSVNLKNQHIVCDDVTLVGKSGKNFVIRQKLFQKNPSRWNKNKVNFYDYPNDRMKCYFEPVACTVNADVPETFNSGDVIDCYCERTIEF